MKLKQTHIGDCKIMLFYSFYRMIQDLHQVLAISLPRSRRQGYFVRGRCPQGGSLPAQSTSSTMRSVSQITNSIYNSNKDESLDFMRAGNVQDIQCIGQNFLHIPFISKNSALSSNKHDYVGSSCFGKHDLRKFSSGKLQLLPTLVLLNWAVEQYQTQLYRYFRSVPRHSMF